MTTIVEKLLERAVFYEQKANALRLAAAEMNGHLTERKQAGAAAMLTAAMQLREQQREPPAVRRPKKPGQPRSGPAYATLREKVAARAARVRQLLLQSGPLSVQEVRAQLGETVSKSRITQVLAGVGARKVGRGVQVRWTLPEPASRATAKRKVGKRVKVTKAQRHARRQRTAALLAKLDLTEPRPLSSTEKQGVSILTQQGYLRKKGDGYIRTAKEFTV